MRDAMVLITEPIVIEKFEKFNEELVRFSMKRGLWCIQGVSMTINKENIKELLKHMEQDNLSIIVVNSQHDLQGLDEAILNEQFRNKEISCLCKEENIVLGKEDNSLLQKNVKNAALVYEEECEIGVMKEYAERSGYHIKSITKQSMLDDEQQKALIKDIMHDDIDVVIMPTSDYFNGEDYTTTFTFTLYNHGIEVHIAKDGINMSKALHDVFQNENTRDEVMKEVMNHG